MNKNTISNEKCLWLDEISNHDEVLFDHFAKIIKIEPILNRSLVSFQANKKRSFYRWYKFKEGFSASLVEYLFNLYHVDSGKILDPFAGSGAALFVASELGIASDGIELLPIGQEIIETRKVVNTLLSSNDILRIKFWVDNKLWQSFNSLEDIPELRITRGAYSLETAHSISKYLYGLSFESDTVKSFLFFALLCVLETVSYTRKDGQYLRWDSRANRKRGGKNFTKGNIPNFEEAISQKIIEIMDDINYQLQPGLFTNKKNASIDLFKGSCLDILPGLQNDQYDSIITSPPYCNRYDYTRTYALELALLGVKEEELKDLRQSMLSCTVENRAKDLISYNENWRIPIQISDNELLLQKILNFLDQQKKDRNLNNLGIPRMVRGYFYEMACVIYECFRVLKPGSRFFMVNDNVRYAGASISVDLILSSIAQKIGFQIENILVLPKGKGNSSQQMGKHGRKTLRKCVYIWRKL